MTDYLKAIKRPFTDLGKLIIGIILTAIPIANFAVIGYWLECAKTSMKKNYTLPDWKMEYFWEGIIIAITALGYLTGVFIILGLILGSNFWITVRSFLDLNTLEMLNLSIWNFNLIITAVIFLLVYYIFTIIIIKYVTEKNFGSLLQFGDIFKKAFTITYFKVWLIMTIYALFLKTILGYVPYAGSTIAVFISQVSFFTAIGEIYPKL